MKGPGKKLPFTSGLVLLYGRAAILSFSGQDSKEQEIYRKALLQHRGWKVHRVWARNVWLYAEKEVERIVGKLER